MVKVCCRDINIYLQTIGDEHALHAGYGDVLDYIGSCESLTAAEPCTGFYKASKHITSKHIISGSWTAGKEVITRAEI